MAEDFFVSICTNMTPELNPYLRTAREHASMAEPYIFIYLHVIVAEMVRNLDYSALPGGEESKIFWDEPISTNTDVITGLIYLL